MALWSEHNGAPGSPVWYEMPALERGQEVLEVLPVLPCVRGDDFRRVAQGAAFHHDRPIKARPLQLSKEGAEVNSAGAELEEDRAALLLAILGAEAGDLRRDGLQLIQGVFAR